LVLREGQRTGIDLTLELPRRILYVGLHQLRQYLREEYADDFNWKLEFAVAQGSYLSDVWVRITKPTGEVVVNSLSDGPWFLTKLPAGTYKVQAIGFGKTFEKTGQVPATGLHTVAFNQWTKAGVAEHTPGATF
jgi:hypothetical protein